MKENDPLANIPITELVSRLGKDAAAKIVTKTISEALKEFHNQDQRPSTPPQPPIDLAQERSSRRPQTPEVTLPISPNTETRLRIRGFKRRMHNQVARERRLAALGLAGTAFALLHFLIPERQPTPEQLSIFSLCQKLDKVSPYLVSRSFTPEEGLPIRATPEGRLSESITGRLQPGQQVLIGKLSFAGQEYLVFCGETPLRSGFIAGASLEKIK